MPVFSLTYIYHDCFVLETAGAVIVFDYWKDPLATPDCKDCPPLLDGLRRGKPVYFLVSHHHKDHYTRRIFGWGSRLPSVRYIVSGDVYQAVRYMLAEGGHYAGVRPPQGSVAVLDPGDEYSDVVVKIKAFPSTDIGNSYAVEADGLKVFHAGDLNAWSSPTGDPEETERFRREFVDIVDVIKEGYPAFDVTMFPVDSRLGGEYWWGARYFVRAIETGLFVPMHFELVMDESEKERRKSDAGAFRLYAREDFGAYVQLASTRSAYMAHYAGNRDMECRF